MKEAESILGEISGKEEHTDHADVINPVFNIIPERLQLSLGSLPEILDCRNIGIEL